MEKAGRVAKFLSILLVFSNFSEAARPGKLFTPAKTTKPDEAALFKGIAASTHGVGILTAEEKKLFRETIDKEKASILRHTMKLVYSHAFSLYRSGDFVGSMDVLKRIVALDPGYEQARALHSALSSSQSGDPVRGGRPQAPKSASEMTQDKFRQALTSYRDGRKVEAVGHFEEVLALEPKHRKAKYYIDRINQEIAKDYFEQGKFAQTQGRLEEALNHFYTAINLDAKSYSFLSRQITILETEVRAKKVQNHLEEALKSLSAGQWDATRSRAQDIFLLDPVNERAQEVIDESYERQAKALMSKGDTLFAKGQYDDAVEEYRKVIKLKVRVVEANKKIDLANAKKKEAEELAKKKEEEEKVRKEEEEKAKAAAEKAAKEGVAVGSPEGGAAKPEAVTEEAKQSSESNYQQAIQFYQSGDYERALMHLNLALKFDPNNQNAYAAKRNIEAKLAK